MRLLVYLVLMTMMTCTTADVLKICTGSRVCANTCMLGMLT
jgi:hypothetical protein